MDKTNLDGLDDVEKQMLEQAKTARKNSYSPYSNFKVGAALLSQSRKIFQGCNVESADFTLTTHAEMNAIDTMVNNGERKIDKLLIVMESKSGHIMPCGLCRQKILEFTAENADIIGVNLNSDDSIKEIYKTNIQEILPFPFRSDNFLKL